MGVEYREDNKNWGFRVFRAGKRYRRSGWDTEAEAGRAWHEFVVGLENTPDLTMEMAILGEVLKRYLEESAQLGRSEMRLDALRYNFKRWILPHFGENTLVMAIKPTHVTGFVIQQKKRNVTNNTIWHYVVDLRSALNWAIKQELLVHNPVDKADLSPIRNRKVVKMPLEPELVDKAAEVLDGSDRIYYDVLRFVGLRMDEGNRLTWQDLDLDRGLMLVPGTKTDDSRAVLPLAPVVIKALLGHKSNKSTSPGDYCFPSQRRGAVNVKVYRRTRLFERIYKRTGIKLTAKDLRDYFATMVVANADPATTQKLLRHTNLTTTTKYLRTVESRMRAAVEGLGK